MPRTSPSTITILASAALATTLVGGCATMPLHTDDSSSGIRAAEEAGAKQVPKASLHLQLANEELIEAKALNERGEHEMATSMLMRAEADAELAVLLSRESTEKSKAHAAVARVHELRQANNQSSK